MLLQGNGGPKEPLWGLWRGVSDAEGDPQLILKNMIITILPDRLHYCRIDTAVILPPVSTAATAASVSS